MPNAFGMGREIMSPLQGLMLLFIYKMPIPRVDTLGLGMSPFQGFDATSVGTKYPQNGCSNGMPIVKVSFDFVENACL